MKRFHPTGGPARLRVASMLLLLASLLSGFVALGWFSLAPVSAASVSCPRDMVQVEGFCIDRFEIAAVDRATRKAVSPYYPPERRWLAYVFDIWNRLRVRVGSLEARRMPLPMVPAWQKDRDYTPMAVSELGRVPQGYLSYHSAKRLCENAGKRLCKTEEWEKACRGQKNTKFPYGDRFRREPCNVFRPFHPAFVLHGLSSSGHLDPRLNLLMIAGDVPVLRAAGASQACTSRWGRDAVFDMVGNLDEWVEDPEGAFRGGFYARRTTQGCEAEISSHSATYFDYSTGARCCADIR